MRSGGRQSQISVLVPVSDSKEDAHLIGFGGSLIIELKLGGYSNFAGEIEQSLMQCVSRQELKKDLIAS